MYTKNPRVIYLKRGLTHPRGVMLHELGHTVGLRHNFAGSADALNFHDEYWDQRVKSIEPVAQFTQGANPSVDALLRSNCSSVLPH